jgi:hypothetical protein
MNPTTARPNPPRSAKSEPRRHNRFPCHEMRFRGVEDQPNARSFRRVALLWLLRAWAFLFWARAISLAACS